MFLFTLKLPSVSTQLRATLLRNISTLHAREASKGSGEAEPTGAVTATGLLPVRDGGEALSCSIHAAGPPEPALTLNTHLFLLESTFTKSGQMTCFF